MADNESIASTSEPESGNGSRYSIGDIGGIFRNRRGRSNASPNDADQENESGEVQSSYSARPAPVARKRKSVPADKAACKAAASMATGVVETLGVMRYGAAIAKMSPVERNMIESGIEGSLASLPSDVAKQVSAASAPVMAAFGLLMYAARLAPAEQYRRANLAEQTVVQQTESILREQQANSTNGVARDNVPDMDTLRGVMG